MLSQALREMGFNATFASSGEAGRRALAQHALDILILDLNLPDMSGIDFLETIREQQSNIQVIILTGFGDFEVARKAIQLEVVAFLTKPCSLGNLEGALSKAKKRRNPEGESALGCLAALLAPHGSLRTCSSLAPYHPPQTTLARRGWVFQQAPRQNGCAVAEFGNLSGMRRRAVYKRTSALAGTGRAMGVVA